MNLFFDIVKFELKKLLCRKRSIIVIALLIIDGALSVFGTVIGNYYYTDENGNEAVITRYEDDMTERRYGEALSGHAIDADLIMEAVEAYKSVPITGGNYYDTPEYQNNARKYDRIYGMVCGTFNLSGIEEFQSLTREQAEQFDIIRRNNREQMINNSAISENMREYQLECLNKSPETLTYEYFGGYHRFVTIMYTTAVMTAAVIAIITSGIFSNEYASGVDSLILSSKNGKGFVIGAKLFTAFSVSAVLIALLSLISLIESFIVWGTYGTNAALELMGSMFPYPVTIGQAVLLYFLCTFMGCMMFSAITALFSAMLKLPFNTIVITALLLIVPMFIYIPAGAPMWLFRLNNLFPANMMAFWGVTSEYQYEIFGLVIPPYIFLPVFALIVTVVCSFFAVRGFRKHQVK